MGRLRAVLHAHIWALAFIFALVGGAVVHLMFLPMGTRLLIATVNDVLSPLFAGHLTIDRVNRVGVTGTLGLDAHVDDADGKRLVTMRGMDARISTLSLLLSLPKGHAPIVVDIPVVSIGDADVQIDTSPSGIPRIAEAFFPRSPAPNQSPGRGVKLTMPRIHVTHAVVRLQPTAPVDADVDDADLSLLYADEKLTVDLSRGRLWVRGVPGGAQAKGRATGHFELSASGAMTTQASWDGTVGEIAERAKVSLRGEELDFSLDVDPTGPAEARALWPLWPVEGASSGHFEGHGTLPRVLFSARVEVGGGTLDVSGPVTVGPTVQATLHAEGKGLDGRAITPPLPCSNINVGADVSLALHMTGEVAARGSIVLAGAKCPPFRVPPATATADFVRGAQGDLAGHADVVVHAPGVPTHASLRLESKRDIARLSFDATASVARFEDVSWLAGAARGAATARVMGAINLSTRSIDAQVAATGRDLRFQGVSLGGARLEGHASGKVEAPSVDFRLDGQKISAAKVVLSDFRAQGLLTLEDGPALHGVTIDVAGEGAPVHARASLVRYRAGDLRMDGAVVEGLGDPLTADIRASRASLVVRAKTAGIDLARVASFAPTQVRTGRLSFALDTVVTAGTAEGHVELDVSHAAVGGWKNVTGHVQASLSGRHAAGRVTASADDVGTLEVHSTSLQIGTGALVTATPWRNAWGSLDVEANVDIAKLAARLPAGALPFESLEGVLEITGRIERDSDLDMTPDVDLTARTTGLVAAGKRASGRWRLDGIDPVIHVVVDGDSGATTVDAQFSDKVGLLANLKASSAAVPYAMLFSDGGVTEALKAMPFDAEVNVPPRSLNSLPVFLGTSGRSGDLEAKVVWRGAMLQPTVDLTGTLIRGTREPNLVGLPVDLALTSHYDGRRLDATLKGSRQDVQVVAVTAVVSASIRDWLAGTSPLPWVASATAKLDRLPLRSIDVLDDRQVAGKVSGQFTLEGLHEDARASASLTFDRLQVGDVGCKASRFDASIDGRTLQVDASLDQVDGGVLRLGLRSGASWGRALTPTIDTAQPAFGTLKATRLRASLLRPFFSNLFTQLDGRIDANASVQIDPAHQVTRPEGTVVLKNGTIEIASLGTEFHGVSGRLTLTPDGIIRLQDVVALGTSGRLSASATAWLTGLSLGGGSASLRIPSDDPLPLVFAGVQLGKLEGRFDATMKHSSLETTVDLNVPTMTLDLPSTGNRDVQELGEMEGVHIGRLQASEFVEEELDPADEDTTDASRSAIPKRQIIIDAHLGGDVVVKKGRALDVRIEGQPRVTFDPNVHVSGQLRLQRGSIDIQGKPFEIERGTITFIGDDPSNPQVVLTAGWTAPDGTRVYADFVGPLKTGKVTLRSEPGRPQNEIFALILFGTTDSQSTSSGGPQTSTVAAQAGGIATAPLNQALGGFNHALDRLGFAGGISTKVDTSTPNPRPEVEVQIARDISLQVAWVLGALPPGTNPDTTLLTLNWRFLRKWALETTVGNQGTSIVDVIWQHRY